MSPTLTPETKNSSRISLAAIFGVVVIAVALLAGPSVADAAKKKRIVALTPFAANTMAELGVQPVGVGQTVGGDRRRSRAIQGGISSGRIKELALSHPNGPNLEELAKLRPSIVLTSPTWKKGTSAIRQLGIRVMTVEPLNLQQVYRQTRQVARLVGRKARGNKKVRQMKRQIQRQTRGIRSRPKVMLILGVGRTPYTFLPNSWGGQLVRAAGGNLLTGGATNSGGFARISDEVVVAEDPDIIIGVPHGNTNDIPGMIEYMKDNPAWNGTKAVENNRVYVSTNNSLLQAGTDVGAVIRQVRNQYLKNR